MEETSIHKMNLFVQTEKEDNKQFYLPVVDIIS